MANNTALPQSASGLESFKHQSWAVTLPEGFKYEWLFQQDAWKHIAVRYKQGDIIAVRSHDHTLYAQLYVRAADRTWVQVTELSCQRFGDEVKTEVGGYAIRWGSPKTLFGVYRESDNERIKDGFQTKEIAAAWLDDHLKKTAA